MQIYLHTYNGHSVRYDHSNTTELDLQIFRELLPTRITRIHGDDKTNFSGQVYCISVAEYELFSIFPPRAQDQMDLLCCH